MCVSCVSACLSPTWYACPCEKTRRGCLVCLVHRSCPSTHPSNQHPPHTHTEGGEVEETRSLQPGRGGGGGGVGGIDMQRQKRPKKRHHYLPSYPPPTGEGGGGAGVYKEDPSAGAAGLQPADAGKGGGDGAGGGCVSPALAFVSPVGATSSTSVSLSPPPLPPLSARLA
jgi:hypothetical protein